MDVVTATKEGHWLLIGRGVRFFSSGSFFDRMTGNGSMPLRQKINEYITSGRRIDALGITQDNNWVITSDNYRYYSSRSKFDAMGLRQAIERQLARGKKISQIAIARNDSWVMISGGVAYYSSGVPAELKKAILDARKQALNPRIVKFRPNSYQWVYIAGQKVYKDKDLNQGVYTWANKYRNFNWEVNEVFIAPNGGWSVISNNTVTKKRSLPEAVQWNVSSKNLWQRMEHHKATAVSIAYIENGNTRWLRSYGHANKKRKTHAYVNTPFAIASMSKAVGSYSIIHAAQQGIVNLDKTLDRYIQENQFSYLGSWGLADDIQDDDPSKRLRKTTLLRLLTHSAGINKHGIGVRRPPTAPLSDVLDGTYDSTPVSYLADAGTMYDYSGGGYTIAESILDVEYSAGSQRWLNGTIGAMGMNQSTFSSMKDKVDSLARLHNTKGEVYFYRDCPVKTAGGLFATASDYSLFLRTLLNGGTTPGGRRLLAPNWNQVMFRPMYREGSTLRTCRRSFECSGLETCVAGRCMRPIKSGSAFIGPGIKMHGPFDERTRLPEIIEHGGAQLSTRTKFVLNMKKKQGIVVFVSGPRKWKNDSDDASEAEKGAGKLLGEILSSYRSSVGW